MSLKKILLVDDDPSMRRLLGAFLSMEGIGAEKFLYASSGEEACKIYEEKKDEIVLVLLDYLMPMMNGEEVFKKLKEINSESNIVMCSCYDERILKNRGVSKANDFLNKPFSFNDPEFKGIIKKYYHDS